MYPAMGATIRAEFLKDLQVDINAGAASLSTPTSKQTSQIFMPSAISTDLSQIAVAIGQAAVTATAIHNNLPLLCR